MHFDASESPCPELLVCCESVEVGGAAGRIHTFLVADVLLDPHAVLIIAGQQQNSGEPQASQAQEQHHDLTVICKDRV